MGVKVFVLGLPGSGKSTATGYIATIAEKQGYTVKTFNDYDILREWFEAAPDGPEFSRTEYDGFDIHDLTVFDTSLRELERQVLPILSSSDKEIIILEFARNNYLHALNQFSASFLHNAYFLFVDAELLTCRDRTRWRIIHRHSSNDHYVSDYILSTYYRNGREYDNVCNLNELCDSNGEPYVVDIQRMMVVNNIEGTPIDVFEADVEQHMLWIIEQENMIFKRTKETQDMKSSIPVPATRGSAT